MSGGRVYRQNQFRSGNQIQELDKVRGYVDFSAAYFRTFEQFLKIIQRVALIV